MRGPEVSPSSLDVVIAPVICWQKRGTEKIWQLGKTSTHPGASSIKVNARDGIAESGFETPPPQNGRPLGASRPACTMAARHRQTECLQPQTRWGQGQPPRRQSGIWRGTDAALVFNGQHIGLPSREWRFKSATLLQAHQPDVYRGWNETFTLWP